VKEIMRLRLEEKSWGEEGRWPKRFCNYEKRDLIIPDPTAIT
jgi:hypothetical protein